MTLKKTGKILSEYSLLTVATLVMNLGIYVFKYPNNFSFGGVSGLSVVLAKLDVNADNLDETVEFTFDGAELLDSFA